MLKSNLSVILKERNLTITQVAQNTGVSRTTLTALAFNHAKGIQFDTINSLCKYIGITPDKLFLYVPFDISLSVSKSFDATEGEIPVDFCIIDRGKERIVKTHAWMNPTYGKDGFITAVEIELDFYKHPDNPVETDFKGIALLMEYIKRTPIFFKHGFENEIVQEILDDCYGYNERLACSFGEAFFEEACPELYVEDYTFHWPIELQFKE